MFVFRLQYILIFIDWSESDILLNIKTNRPLALRTWSNTFSPVLHMTFLSSSGKNPRLHSVVHLNGKGRPWILIRCSHSSGLSLNFSLLQFKLTQTLSVISLSVLNQSSLGYKRLPTDYHHWIDESQEHHRRLHFHSLKKKHFKFLMKIPDRKVVLC